MVALSPRSLKELKIEIAARGRRQILRRGLRPQGAGREGRRPSRPPRIPGVCRSRETESRSPCRRGKSGRGPDRPRRAPLFHAQVCPQFAHHLRFRRRPELRGRDRTLSPIHLRPDQQHLPQARRARRPDDRDIERARGPGRPAASPSMSVRTKRPISGMSSLMAAKFEEEVLHSIESLEFSHLAKYTFNLCQKFNGYYHKYPVLAEDNPGLKNDPAPDHFLRPGDARSGPST